jgi:hypothetical protein
MGASLSYPNLGFAAFVALLAGAVIQPRGVMWIIAPGMCVLGAGIWLLTAIALPVGNIRWANGATFVVAASSVLGLRWTSPRGRVDAPTSDLPELDEPSDRDA